MNVQASHVKAALSLSLAALLFAIITLAVSGGGISQIGFLLNSVLVTEGDSLDLIEGNNITIAATSSGTGVSYTITATGSGGGGATQDLFETITSPFGTDVVADSPNTILNLTSSDSTITVSGNQIDTTIDFFINQSLLEFYSTIQDEGGNLTQRRFLNFTGSGITCTDDGNDSTDCDVPGATASNSFTTIAPDFGTNPVADSPNDTLNVGSSDNTILVTGSASTDTLDFGINQDLLEFYSTIQVSGSSIDKRRLLNFLGEVSCEDNPSELSTDCIIGSEGAGVEVPITKLAVKTEDEIVNNSNTLQDDDHLSLNIGGDGQIWGFKAILFFDSSSTADLSFTFSCPPGTVMRNLTDTLTQIEDCEDIINFGLPGVGTIVSVNIYGILETTSTGDFTLRWAQQTAEASDTTMYAGSYIEVVRLDALQEVGGQSGPHAITHAESGSDALFSQHGLGLGQTGSISTTGSDIENIRVPIFNTFTIKDIRCRVREAPSGSDIIIDALKNGSTIFTTTTNRPSIANGQLEGVSGTPDITNITVGDFYNLDIVQVGSTTPGEDLVCVTRLRQALYDSD